MAEPAKDSVGKRVISGFRWLAMARLAGQAGTWVVTLVVIRLLTPDDYGLMAMATIVIGFFALLEEFGMGAAITQRSELPDGLVSKVFGVVILVNSTAAVLLLLLAHPMAAFFDEPRITPIIWVLTLRFPLLTMLTIPQAMLDRRMQFKRKAMVIFVAMITGSVISLILALSGAGVWSLVYSSIGATLVRTIGMNLAARHFEWPSFSFKGMREVVTFGGQVTVMRVLWYVYSKADVFVIGRLLGKEVLGLYAVAMQLASLPMKKLAANVNEVGFVGFSRLQDDKAEIARQFMRATELVAIFSFPVFFGISTIAPEIVTVILGPEWIGAIVPLQLLSLSCPLRMINQVLNSALLGIGKADVALVNTGLTTVILPASFLFGAQYGLVGVCWAWIIGFTLCFAAIAYRSLPLLHVSRAQYVKLILAFAASAGTMWIAVSLARQAVTYSGTPPGVYSLAALIAVGAGVFGLIALTLHRSSAALALKMVR